MVAIFKRLKKGLSKSRTNITEKITTAIKRSPKLDEVFWEDLEEALISSDVGFEATVEIVDKLRADAKKQRLKESADIQSLLIENITEILSVGKSKILKDDKQIIIVFGVNGTGKTTTIAKLYNLAKSKGKESILAAADTFRAAAIEQLEIWANRLSAKIVKHERGSDPAAVVYDSIKAADARNSDYVIADTAGRLHTQANLMDELKKIKRVATEKAGDYTVKTLLVLDANTGQNALVQTKLFNEALGVDEIALAKMDGTAKGGIVIAIAKEFRIPISFIGIGEGIDDIEEFDPKSFSEALFQT